MKSALLLCCCLLGTLAAWAQVPVHGFVNPSCETVGMPPFGFEVVAGTGLACEVDPRSVCSPSVCEPFAPADGQHVFLDGTSDGADEGLAQTLPLPGEQAVGMTFTFSAQVQDCFAQTPGGSPDRAQLQLQFLDLQGETLETFTSDLVDGPRTGSYASVEVEGVAPAGTELLRVAFWCREADGGYCDVAFDDLRLTTGAAIPVELTRFEGSADGAAVLLTWTTASETNNAGFGVELRRGGAFEQLAFVEGRGTTTEAQRYRFRTEALAPGTHTFRLRQSDFDGTESFSREVDVVIGLETVFRLEEAAPNPFANETQIGLIVARTQHVRVDVTDALGRIVRTLHDGTLAAGQPRRLVFDAAGLPSGLYLVRLVGRDFRATRRVVLLN